MHTNTCTAWAQTATTIRNDLDAVSLIIPVACVSLCTPWQAAFSACPVAAVATFETCVCSATHINAATACFNCMTTELTADDDTQAAVPSTALTDLGTYCDTAVQVSTGTATSTSTRTSLTTTTTTTSTTSSTTTTSSSTTTSAATSASSSGSSSSSSYSPRPSVVTVSSLDTGVGFPTQTKSANVFSGATRQHAAGVGAGLVGGVALMAMLA
ncbi:hypothetical protein OIV83_003940 [Microbotryomycetes sp. JL201]|nr:hypothetical protein OIV83_003940 [Microbotryomycetes sp. JL201]